MKIRHSLKSVKLTKDSTDCGDDLLMFVVSDHVHTGHGAHHGFGKFERSMDMKTLWTTGS